MLIEPQEYIFHVNGALHYCTSKISLVRIDIDLPFLNFFKELEFVLHHRPCGQMKINVRHATQ
jgi:hypothetical protein